MKLIHAWQVTFVELDSELGVLFIIDNRKDAVKNSSSSRERELLVGAVQGNARRDCGPDWSALGK